MILTKPQRQALKRVWLRTCEPGILGTLRYREFRRQNVAPGPGCTMVRFCNMWLGIEPDGYTHS